MMIRNLSATDIGVGDTSLAPGASMPFGKGMMAEGATEANPRFADPLLEGFRRAGVLTIEKRGEPVKAKARKADKEVDQPAADQD